MKNVEKNITEIAKDLFTQMDKNRDGLISFSEFSVWFAKFVNTHFEHWDMKPSKKMTQRIQTVRQFIQFSEAQDIPNLLQLLTNDCILVKQQEKIVGKQAIGEYFSKKNCTQKWSNPLYDTKLDKVIIMQIGNEKVKCEFEFDQQGLVKSISINL